MQILFVQDELNKLVVHVLREESVSRGCDVFTYCLMPDHLHSLVGPHKDGRSVLLFVNRFKGRTTKASWKVGWRGWLWQPRFYDHALRSGESLRQVAEYILQNPVRKSLVSRPGDWRWSGEMNPLPIQ